MDPLFLEGGLSFFTEIDEDATVEDILDLHGFTTALTTGTY